LPAVKAGLLNNRAVQFGVYALPDYHADSDGPTGAYLRKLIDHLCLAEELGADHLWANEHHYHPFGGVIASPPVLLAGLAQRTSRARLGTSIAILPLHHPIKLAEQLAMVDLMSGGRLEVGVGRGFVVYDYEVAGLPFEEGQARTTESLEVMLQAWSGEPFSHSGRFFRFDNLLVWPAPEQRPHPPIWVACANNPDSFAWTGRQGYNLLTIGFIKPVDKTAALTRIYRDAASPGSHSGTLYQVVVDEDGATARQRALAAMSRYLELNLEAQALAASKEAAARVRAEMENLDVDRLVDEGRLIAGRPDECVSAIRRLEAEIGFDQVVCMFQFGGIDFAAAERSLRLFAAEVLPKLR
jgi:alkanesulfonate monooxygenase SsuD/methylene tetrahydromethanopterin reductase-like flavin-dependent oxidoreductase (luciferase family)